MCKVLKIFIENENEIKIFIENKMKTFIENDLYSGLFVY